MPALIFTGIGLADPTLSFASGWYSNKGKSQSISASNSYDGIHLESGSAAGADLTISGVGTSVEVTGASTNSKINNTNSTRTSGIQVSAQGGTTSSLSIQGGAHLDVESGVVDMYGDQDAIGSYGNGIERITIGDNSSVATSVLELGSKVSSVSIGEGAGADDAKDTFTINKSGELLLDGTTDFGGYGTLVGNSGTIRLKQGAGELYTTAKLSLTNSTITDADSSGVANSVTGSFGYAQPDKNGYGHMDIKSAGGQVSLTGVSLTGNVLTSGNIDMLSGDVLNASSLTMHGGQLSLSGINNQINGSGLIDGGTINFTDTGTGNTPDSITELDPSTNKPYPSNYLLIGQGKTLTFNKGHVASDNGSNNMTFDGTVTSTVAAKVGSCPVSGCIANTGDHISFYGSQLVGDLTVNSGNVYIGFTSNLNGRQKNDTTVDLEKGTYLQLQSESNNARTDTTAYLKGSGRVTLQSSGTFDITGDREQSGNLNSALKANDQASIFSGSISQQDTLQSNTTVNILGNIDLETAKVFGLTKLTFTGETATLDSTDVTDITQLTLGASSGTKITFKAENQTDVAVQNLNIDSGSAVFDNSSLDLSGGKTQIASQATLSFVNGSTLDVANGNNTIAGDISMNNSTLALFHTTQDPYAAPGTKLGTGSGSLTFQSGSQISMTSSQITLGDGKGSKGDLTFSSGSTLDVEAGDQKVTNSTKTGSSDYGALVMSNGSTLAVKDHGQLGVLGNMDIKNSQQNFDDSSFSGDLVDVSGDLTLGGKITLSDSSGQISTGMYHLYTYGGKLHDPTGATVDVGGLPTGDKAVLNTGTNGEVDVCVYNSATASSCNVFQPLPKGGSATWSGSGITSKDAQGNPVKGSGTAGGQPGVNSTSDANNPIIFGNSDGSTTKITIPNNSNGSSGVASAAGGVEFGSPGYQISGGTLTSSAPDQKDKNGKDTGTNGLNIGVDKGTDTSKDAPKNDSISSNIGDGSSVDSSDSTKHTDVNVSGNGTLVINHDGKEGYTGSTNVNGANLQIGDGTSNTSITNSSGTNVTNGGSVTVNKNSAAGSINSTTGSSVSVDGSASSVSTDDSKVAVGSGGTVSGTDKSGKSSTAITATNGSDVSIAGGGKVGNISSDGSIVSSDGTTGDITSKGSKVTIGSNSNDKNQPSAQTGSINSTNSDTTINKNGTVTGSVTASGGQTTVAGQIVPGKGSSNGNSDNSGSLTVNDGGTATITGSVGGDLNVGSSGVNSSSAPSSVTMDHGSIGGNATIGSKSSLSGSGTVTGNVSVGSGGSINITGTGNPNDGQSTTDNGSGINIKGGLTMGDGSSITDNGSGTSIQVGGDATVGNVTVHETGVNRGDLTPDSKHNQVIVHSNGSITDKGSITVDGMGPLVSWTTGVTNDPNGGHDITITYSGKSYSSIGGSGDQVSVGRGLDGLGAAGQSITIPLGAIGTVDGLRKAYSALSGEINADARTAMINNSYTLQEAAIGRLDCLNDDIRKKTFGSEVVKNNYCGIDPKHPFTVWGRAFGTKGDSFANSGTGIASMSQSTAGWIMGADAQMAGTWRVGGLLSYGRDWYGAGDGLISSGHSNDISLGMYAGNAWQMNNGLFDAALTLKLGAIYTWDIMHNRREVSFQGYDGILSSNALGGTFQGFTELGYKMMFNKQGKMPMEIEPFVRMSFVNFNTDNYSEHGATAALLVQGEDTTVGYVDMGVKAATSIQVGKSGSFSPHMALSYRRAYGDTSTRVREAFAAAHSDDYNMAIDGVPISTDTADVNIGATVHISDRLDLDADYIGQYGNHVTASGGLGTIRYHF